MHTSVNTIHADEGAAHQNMKFSGMRSREFVVHLNFMNLAAPEWPSGH